MKKLLIILCCVFFFSTPCSAISVTAEAGAWGDWTLATLNNISETRRILQIFSRGTEFTDWCTDFFMDKEKPLSVKTEFGKHKVLAPHRILWVTPSPEGTLVLSKEKMSEKIKNIVLQYKTYCPVFVFKYDFPELKANNLYNRFKILSINRVKKTFPYIKSENSYIYDVVFPDIDILNDMATITGEFFER